MPDAGLTQRDYWNGEAGARWARNRRTIDAVFAPLTEALFAGARLRPDDIVLDVGCGGGDCTLAAARRIGPGGRVVAADISAPLLGIARERAATEPARSAPIAFLEADAQAHDFGDAVFTRIVSRFGVMFFDDSAAAFANLRRALMPGGRLTFLCWRPLAENAWIAVPRDVVLPMVPEPEPSPPDGPGPFRFADPAVLDGLLGLSGFRDVAIEPVERVLTLGASPEAAAFVLELGPVSRLVRDGGAALRAAAHAAVTADFAARAEAGTVSLGAACWRVSAVR